MVLGSPLEIRHGDLVIRHQMAGLGFDPPDFVIDAVTGAVDADAQRRLHAQGRQLGDRILKLPGKKTAVTKPGAWERLAAPIAGPLVAGLKEALQPKLIGAAAALVAAGAAVGYLFGKRRRR
jgi:hypothetical protein